MFIKILEEVYQQELENNPDTARKSDSWRSSSLGSCLRGQFLSRLLSNNFQVMHDRRTMDVFELGHLMEAIKIKALMKHQNYVVMTQGEMFDTKLNLKGHFDALVFDKTTKELFMFECKSKNSRAFTYMDKKHEGAMHHHKLQINSYMKIVNEYGFTFPIYSTAEESLYFTNHIMPIISNENIFVVSGYTKAPDGSDNEPIYKPVKSITEGALLYVSKDDQRLLEYPVYANDEALIQEWTNEVKMLENAFINKEVLPENKAGTWQSKYCKFCEAGLCAKINDKEIVVALMEATANAQLQKDNEPL